MRAKKLLCLLLSIAAVSSCLCGCPTEEELKPGPTASPTQPAELVMPQVLLPSADGTVVKESGGVRMDASNAGLGYVMVKSEENSKALKVNISTADGSYFYDLPSDDSYVTYPLQMGSGQYTIKIYEHVVDNSYSALASWGLKVEMEDENSVYLFPSQYVDYDSDSDIVAASARLCQGLESDRDKAEAIYRYVADKVEYDYDKAATVQSGYLPYPDETLKTYKGICFDYSALLAAMLRVQGIPTSLVIGDVLPEGYLHAWNRVYLDGAWVHMDATLDGQGKEEEDYVQERIY